MPCTPRKLFAEAIAILMAAVDADAHRRLRLAIRQRRSGKRSLCIQWSIAMLIVLIAGQELLFLQRNDDPLGELAFHLAGAGAIILSAVFLLIGIVNISCAGCRHDERSTPRPAAANEIRSRIPVVRRSDRACSASQLRESSNMTERDIASGFVGTPRLWAHLADGGAVPGGIDTRIETYLRFAHSELAVIHLKGLIVPAAFLSAPQSPSAVSIPVSLGMTRRELAAINRTILSAAYWPTLIASAFLLLVSFAAITLFGSALLAGIFVGFTALAYLGPMLAVAIRVRSIDRRAG